FQAEDGIRDFHVTGVQTCALPIHNADQALARACQETDATIKDYTAGPIYFNDGEAGGHEWIIEFEKHPSDFRSFCEILDTTLREINSDYDAKRFKDMALGFPRIHNAPSNTFYNWMKSKGKLGGQNKVPRLANNREYLDPIIQMMKSL